MNFSKNHDNQSKLIESEVSSAKHSFLEAIV